MTFVSYAQNFEDVMLWRALGSEEAGFYVDVGANDPSMDSVTKGFYERGWSGINIEPVEACYKKLADTRIRDTNLQVATGHEVSEGDFYEFEHSGLSTLVKSIADGHAQTRGISATARRVDILPLKEILSEHAPATIHFLKIDVEGFEYNTLAGMDFKLHRPWVIVVEASLPNTQIKTGETWSSMITNSGYVPVYFDGLNQFFIAEEKMALQQHFAAPPNFFDDFLLCENHHLATLTRTNQHELQLSLAGELADRRAEIEQYQTQVRKIRQAGEIQQLKLANKVAELNTRSQFWYTEATSAKDQIGELKNSSSWRITKPLRLIRHPLKLAHRVWERSTAGLRTRAINAIRRNPRIRATTRLLAQKYPRLRNILLQQPTLVPANGANTANLEQQNSSEPAVGRRHKRFDVLVKTNSAFQTKGH